jgi:hypothetical protein
MQNDHVSVDEAVARLLNLDFVPAPYTVIELLEGFLLQAEEKYERIPAGTGNQIERNSDRAVMKVCESRLDLGKVLVEAIESEIKQGNLIAKSTTSSVQLLSWSKIRAWAEEMFGLTVIDRIVAPEAKPAGVKRNEGDQDKDSLDLVLASWGRTKSKNFLITFYALAYHVAFARQSNFLHADRSIIIDSLAEEMEGLVKKYAKPKSIQFQGRQAIKDRLEMAEKVWNQAVDGVKRTGK